MSQSNDSRTPISSTKENARLARHLIPEKYSIHYSVLQLEEPFRFEGTNEILVSVQEITTQVTLHAQNLNLKHVELHSEDGSKQEALNISYDEKNSTVTFQFKETLKVGTKAKLLINFEGKLNEKLMGLYRSSYMKDGKKKYLAVTQMEPVDCRRAVPCWDEPDLKAIFELSLVKHPEHIAISNMPIVEEKPLSENEVLVKFAPTPKMSSYLLAIIVGEFDFLENTTPEGVKLRIYLPPGKREQGHFALNVATKALSFLTRYFGIEYPLPKSDLICISDFAAGAMENWGAVTYRDIKLLLTEDSSLTIKHGAARTICHELAHMWFGNLVTMKWWTHLWLNEGFARFTEFIAVHDIFPEWDIWSSFNVSVLGYAFSADSLQSSHPIEVEVNHPAEINEIFDAISYAKGASVLRMLATYLTQEVFLKGLRIYLEKFKYSNASTEDLWNALETASNKPVADIMNNWTKKVGYPLVSVHEKYNEDKTQIIGLKLSQRRFLKDLSLDTSVIWKIPVDYVTEEAPNTPVSFLFSNQHTEILLQKPISSSSWIKLNVNQTGLYRVEYSETMLQRLKKPIIEKTLKNVDRLSIVGDAFSLSRKEKLLNVLSLFQAYKEEHEYYVWSQISSIFGQLNSSFNSEPFYPQFKKYVISIFEPLYKNVLNRQWDSPKDCKDPFDAALRALCISRLGYAGYTEVIEEAKRRFQVYVVEKNQNALKSDFVLPVFKIVLENGTEKEFQALLEYYRTTESVEEKRTILQILGSVPKENLIQQVLDFSISEEVRKNDIAVVLSSIAVNPKGRQLVWEFMKAKWDNLYKSFGEGQFLLASIINTCTSHLNTEKAAEDVKKFFEDHPIADAQRTILQSIETIRDNASFLNSNSHLIQTWLNENKY